MPLLALPNELLLQIARCLLHCPSCHCLHISQHLSALSRSNCRLHALLTASLVDTASTLHHLLWAISHSRHDTVALTLAQAVDPNTPLQERRCFPFGCYIHIRTPVDVAIRMCLFSSDAESHVLQLATVALLLAAGGICTVDSLITTTRRGQLDLLALCIPHLPDINARRQCGRHTLLEIAARGGHVEAVTMLISAGATFNGTGAHSGPESYPLLLVCGEFSVAVLQVLLDAGADATWRDSHGVSIVQHIRQTSWGAAGLENNVALLVQFGAVDETPVGGRQRRRERPRRAKEYHGWIGRQDQEAIDWEQEWVAAGRDEGCGCSNCTVLVTGGYCATRRIMSGRVDESMCVSAE